MNEFTPPIVVYFIAEGATEALFIKRVLKPYLTKKNVVLKPGIAADNKDNIGGNVSIERLLNFICKALSKPNCYVTTIFDFYGCKPQNWSALQNAVCQEFDSAQRSKIVADDLRNRILAKFPELNPQRFIPYVSMYEFEALLFSEPKILADELDVSLEQIEKILKDFHNPEEINHSKETAPSKRLRNICLSNKQTYDKIADGVTIAEAIGVDAMRAKCPLFNAWIESLENLSSLK